METMKVKRSGSARRRRQEKRNKMIRLLAIVMTAVLIVLCIIALTRNSSDNGDGSSDAVPAYKAADVDSRQLIDAAKSELSMQVGDLCMLTLPEGVDIRGVSFSSDDSSVVRVDAAGRIDALKTGTAKIIAMANGFSAVCECTVTPAPREPAETDASLTTAYTANADIVKQNAETGGIGEYLYSLTVNRRTNTVTVYTYDKNGDYTVPVRAMVCSCGRAGDSTTPTGEFEVYYREDWLELSGDVYGQYISGFNGDILFHSVPYRTLSKSDLKVEEFNKLGDNASEGCVRLMVSDVLWIYENCPVGTFVKVIDADASADPLGKPPAVRLDGSVKWDPTDPDSANPYKGRTPSISGTDDASLDAGDSFDPMYGVKATDTCGNDISDRVVIAGVVVSDKPGVYYLTYTITDDFRRTCEVTRVVVVE